MRTPVGLKCQACAAPVVRDRPRRRLRVLGFVVPAAVAVALIALPRVFAHPGGHTADDETVGISRTTSNVAGATVADGRAPDGRGWGLEARTNERGEVCTRLTVTGASAAREFCDPPPTRRPFATVHLRGFVRNGRVSNISWGVVSEATDRVRTTGEDGTTDEVPTVGGDAGLGVRFFVSFVNRVQAVTFTAVGADGQELGRIDPPPVPPPTGR